MFVASHGPEECLDDVIRLAVLVTEVDGVPLGPTADVDRFELVIQALSPCGSGSALALGIKASARRYHVRNKILGGRCQHDSLGWLHWQSSCSTG